MLANFLKRKDGLMDVLERTAAQTQSARMVQHDTAIRGKNGSTIKFDSAKTWCVTAVPIPDSPQQGGLYGCVYHCGFNSDDFDAVSTHEQVSNPCLHCTLFVL
jgi:hypothetical protein